VEGDVAGEGELVVEIVSGAEKLPIGVKEASAELEAKLEGVILWRVVLEGVKRVEALIV
jgi:hypothetical protein